MQTVTTQSDERSPLWVWEIHASSERDQNGVTHVVTTTTPKGRKCVALVRQGNTKAWLTSVDGPFATPDLIRVWAELRDEIQRLARGAA